MSKLTDVLNKLITTTKNNSSTWDITMFPHPTEIKEGMSYDDYHVGTPLEGFYRDVKTIMDKTGYSYSLAFRTFETYDGGCFEFVYVLTWWNGTKLRQIVIDFETPY